MFRVAAPPGPLVDANIDSFIEEGAAVSRYRSVDIDDRSALVIWLAERPNELTAAIATFVGYDDETVFLFSRYSPDNEGAEAEILAMHASLTNLADESASEPESSPETVTEEPPVSAPASDPDDESDNDPVSE